MSKWSSHASMLVLLLIAGSGCGSQEAALLAATEAQAVTVGARGTAATLDVANWNVEWFGDTGNGPSNESLQVANVRDTIAGTDFDVWALEEVVSAASFQQLLSGLSGYGGILASDGRVTSGSSYYAASEQKPALVWKTSLATFSSARLILTSSDYDFAGRPPLEVKLNVALNGSTEQRVFIVLHMKAMSESASWRRRSNASVALKSYLDATYPTQKVIVLGDWNDDLDTSITSGEQTPYQNFLSDPERYAFVTRTLTQSGIATTCGYSDTIDHQLATQEQAADLISGSVQVYRLDSVVSSFCSTTTDHYPVLARYQFGGGSPPTPSSGKVFINEILANEPGSNTVGEFVELVNGGSSAVDLSGWALWDGIAARHAFASGTVLAAGKAIAIFGATSGIPSGTPSAVGSSTGTLSLGNSGDSVSLRDASGTLVGSFTYGASLSSVDGASMNRSPDATPGASFVLHTGLSGLSSSPGKKANGASF
jgi:endonuclease/exonuclease/phosphatase family metal-dependent hydrolase